MSRMRRESPLGQVVAGLAILTFGIVIWLDHLHNVPLRQHLQWWPVVLIALGVTHLFERRGTGGLVLIIVGAAFLPRIPGFPHLRLSFIIAAWPILISV